MPEGSIDRSLVLDIAPLAFKLTTKAYLVADGGDTKYHHGPLAKTLYALHGDQRLLRHLGPRDTWQGDLTETISKPNMALISAMLYSTFRLLQKIVEEGKQGYHAPSKDLVTLILTSPYIAPLKDEVILTLKKYDTITAVLNAMNTQINNALGKIRIDGTKPIVEIQRVI